MQVITGGKASPFNEEYGLKVETWPIADLVPYDNNPRKITPAAVEKVARSIARFGFNAPIIVDEDGVILAGHNRRQALLHLGAGTAAVIVKSGLSDDEKRAYRIADNRVAEESDWDEAKLQAEVNELRGFDFDISELGFDQAELDKLLAFDGTSLEPAASEGKERTRVANGDLAARFGIPPFTVLNARSGWWQERKSAWLALGIESELGRGASPGGGGGVWTGKDASGRTTAAVNYAAPGGSPMPSADSYRKDGGARGNGAGRKADAASFGAKVGGDAAEAGSINGTSIFDPVLCELAYRWFCPPGGIVLDPFAGGSVRGIVASRLGREYHGVDLRQEQIEANCAQLNLAHDPAPTWYRGDSTQLDRIVPKSVLADLIFTCPPYADLERYSDDPADLSTMPWHEFLRAYGQIIEQSAARLKPCRFAVFIVGDVRGPEGAYYGLPWKTVELCEAAGLRLYNEAVLITMVGSLPLRAAIPFTGSRKLGKTHQNVLVFVKGDAKAAARDIGECDFADETDEEAAIGVEADTFAAGVTEL